MSAVALTVALGLSAVTVVILFVALLVLHRQTALLHELSVVVAALDAHEARCREGQRAIKRALSKDPSHDR